MAGCAAFSASYGGFGSGDHASDLGGTLAFSTAANASSPVGHYAVTPGGLTSSNYDITFTAGSLSVTPAPLSVTAEPSTKAHGAGVAAVFGVYGGVCGVLGVLWRVRQR